MMALSVNFASRFEEWTAEQPWVKSSGLSTQRWGIPKFRTREWCVLPHSHHIRLIDEKVSDWGAWKDGPSVASVGEQPWKLNQSQGKATQQLVCCRCDRAVSTLHSLVWMYDDSVLNRLVGFNITSITFMMSAECAANVRLSLKTACKCVFLWSKEWEGLSQSSPTFYWLYQVVSLKIQNSTTKQTNKVIDLKSGSKEYVVTHLL